jgi:prevent-host-death family protein
MRTELLTTLKRKATELISEISTAREPLLITQHGMPAAYLVDVATYELMESRIGLLEGIAKGEKAIFEGRVVSNEDARARMSRWPKM